MRNIVLVMMLITLAFTSCKAKQQQSEETIADEVESVYVVDIEFNDETHHITVIYEEAENDYIFTLKGFEFDYQGRPQKLQLPTELIYHGVSDISPYFWSSDMNFDDYMDITIELPSEGDNINFIFFLYNPSTQKHEYSEKLSNLSGLQSDPETKTLKDVIWAGDSWESNEYRWEGTNLVLFRTTTLDREEGVEGSIMVTNTLQPDGTWTESTEHLDIYGEKIE